MHVSTADDAARRTAPIGQDSMEPTVERAPLVSICILTYKRAACLAELLESIVDQQAPELEVVICDDASPDDTPAVVDAFRGRISRLTAIRHPENIGLQRNFLAVVEAAKGDFIWFMGDDDRLEPGAVPEVLAAIRRWPGVLGLTLGVIDYAPDLSEPIAQREMPDATLLRGAPEVFARISDLLGFMSSMVVDRRAWLEASAKYPPDPANYYPHVYIVGRMLGADGPWGVTPYPCVAYRTSNDQFLTDLGWLGRLRIDVMGYEQIAAALFAKRPDVRSAISRKTFVNHAIARIRKAKIAPGPTPDVAKAIALLFNHYKFTPEFWLVALPLLLAPRWLLRSARDAARRAAGRPMGA